MRNLDHLAVNFEDVRDIENFTIENDPAFTDHNMILTSIKEPNRLSRGCETILKTQIRYERLKANFMINSEEFLQCDETDVILDKITKPLQECIQKSSSTSTFKVKHPEKVGDWVLEKTLLAMKEKDKALSKKRKKPFSFKIAERLRIASAHLIESNRQDVSRYLKQQFSSSDPKKKWRCINAVLGRKNNLDPPSSIIHENATFSQPSEIANIFNDFFANCANIAMKNIPDTSEPLVEKSTSTSLTLHAPSIEEIMSIIKSLRNKAAPGHDGIHPKVIKNLSSELAPLLSHLISKIFETGHYPVCLKIAIFTPIFKSGSNKNIDNYRPISVLPIINKIVEKVIHRRIINFCCEHLDLLYSHQFGFRARSSTLNAALELCNMIQKGVDGKKIVSAIFMDLKKAFDIVDHETLLKVLAFYGFRGKCRELFESYQSRVTYQ
jgi:hypothetical protein